MAIRTAHDNYDEALTEALDRNTHRRKKQNVAIFLIANIAQPCYYVMDCGADYRPQPTRINPDSLPTLVGLVDCKEVVWEHFGTL